MDKINLVIADNNIDFLEFLASYIRKTDYINTFSTKSFSSIDNLITYLQTDEKVNILLIDQSLYTTDIFSKDIDLIINLSEMAVGLRDEQNHLYKYQPLNNFFSQVLTMYIENDGYIPKSYNSKEKTKVVSVFSTTGGSGKTLLAVNFAKQLAQREYKVFYLSLEALNSTSLFFSISDSYDFSKIIYYLRTTPTVIKTKIELYKRYDQFLKIDYFEPASNLMEVKELTSEDTINLIDAIIDTEQYDFLIIDLDSNVDGRLIGSISKSNYFFWLLLDNYVYLSKTKLLLKEITINSEFKQFYEQISFIQNKALINNQDNYLYEFKIAGYLPYIPNWKDIIDVNDFYKSDKYTEGVLNLIELITA